MNTITSIDKSDLPSTASLIKATLFAMVVAAVILVTAILPAEYGIDPTRLGNAMGLTVLNEANSTGRDEATEVVQRVSPPTESLNVTPVWKGKVAPRSDNLTLTLQPGQGAEIKSMMATGDTFVFGWKAEGGKVFFDMHGEPPNAGNEFTSYWVGKGQSEASGTFTAPFAGTHGWYWQNTGSAAVTISLTTSGFYSGLYMP